MIPVAMLFPVLSAAGQIGPVQAELTLKRADMKFLLPTPMPQRLTLSANPPGGAKSAARSGVMWGALPFGPDANHRVVLAIDGGDPLAHRLHVDANGDGDPFNDPPCDWKRADADNAASARHEGLLDLPADAARPHEALRVVAYRYEAAAAKARALSADDFFYYRDYAAQAQIAVAGKSRTVLLSDESSRGSFAFPREPASGLQLGVDIDLDGQVGGNEWFAPGQMVDLTTAKLTLKQAAADGRSAEFLAIAPDARYAPSFSGPGLDGRTIRFPEDFKGKLVLLDFWATWCAPCRAEIPNLVATAKKFADDKRFEILSVSLDSPGTQKMLGEFVAKNNMTTANWRHVAECKQWATEIGRAYGVNSVPRVLLIDADTQQILADGGPLRGPPLQTTVANALANRKK